MIRRLAETDDPSGFSCGSTALDRYLTTQASHLPRYPLPALLIARLAVDEEASGCGIGRTLLTFALEEALVLHSRTGCVAAVVDAKPEAVSYYEQFGFEPLSLATTQAAAVRLFLEIGSIADALT